MFVIAPVLLTVCSRFAHGFFTSRISKSMSFGVVLTVAHGLLTVCSRFAPDHFCCQKQRVVRFSSRNLIEIYHSTYAIINYSAFKMLDRCSPHHHSTKVESFCQIRPCALRCLRNVCTWSKSAGAQASEVFTWIQRGLAAHFGTCSVHFSCLELAEN